MNKYKLEKTEFIDTILKTLKNQKRITLYCIYNEYYFLPGGETELPPNYDILEEKHITKLDIPTMGGTIVISPGDIHIGAITETNTKTNAFLDSIREGMAKLIRDKGLNCILEGNDILIMDNGVQYKVAGAFSKMVGNVCIGGYHISINVDLDLIKSVCNKEMVKIPRGLSEFGITTDDVEKTLLKVLKESDPNKEKEN